MQAVYQWRFCSPRFSEPYVHVATAFFFFALYFLRRWDYSVAVANAFCQLLLERQLLFWPQNYFISYPNQIIFVPKPYKTRCLQSRIQLEFASFRNVLITSLPGSNEASGAVSPVSFLGTLYNESMMIDLDIEYLP